MERETKKTDIKIVLVTAPEGDSTVELAKRLVGALVKHLTAKKRRTRREWTEL